MVFQRQKICLRSGSAPKEQSPQQQSPVIAPHRKTIYASYHNSPGNECCLILPLKGRQQRISAVRFCALFSCEEAEELCVCGEEGSCLSPASPSFFLFQFLLVAPSVPPLCQMNHAAAGKRHAQELLETLYRELAILGIVAFILWSINVSPAVDIEVCMAYCRAPPPPPPSASTLVAMIQTRPVWSRSFTLVEFFRRLLSGITRSWRGLEFDPSRVCARPCLIRCSLHPLDLPSPAHATHAMRCDTTRCDATH